jgi:proline iminopeptidase
MRGGPAPTCDGAHLPAPPPRRRPAAVPTPREDFLAFRKALPRPPRLARATVRVRGLDLAVFTTPEVAGGGPPLLCVNGGLLFDHHLLWPALSPLAARRRLVLYDQRGRGASQAPPGPQAARIEHDAGDIPALREALGIARWDVLGHSWGGGLAALGCARDAAGVRRLVLVDAVGPTSAWMDRLQPDGVARLGGPTDPLGARLAAFGPAELTSLDPAVQTAWANALYPAWFADRALAEGFAPPRSASRTGAAVAARLRREGYDWREPIGALRVPTLVIHGTEDLLPVEVARELAGTIAGSQLALVPDAGHMPFWEAPTRFFALVEEYLSAMHES